MTIDPSFTVPGGLPGPSRQPVQIHSLQVAARIAITGLTVQAVLLAPSLILSMPLTSAPGQEPRPDDPMWLALGEVILLGALATVGTAAAFITWLYVAIKNLHSWGIRGLRIRPGWAIAGWFIPLANLVIPAKVVSTVIRGSRVPADGYYAEKGGTDLVRTWWLFFVLGWIMALITFNGLSGSPGYVYTVLVLYHGFNFVAAVLAIVLIRRATRQQARRQETRMTIPGVATEPTAA